MVKVCLAIGISDAPPLDFLPGATNGARAMAAWATAAGYDETRLLVDDDSPIGTDTIREALTGRPAAPGQAAVRGLLQQTEPIERLLVYFAGHGLARDAEEDLWLVSQWNAQERAIAVGGFRRKLERFGIAQIVIVADACRSGPADQKSADLTADKVLGAGPVDANLPKADIFKASSKFRAAFMIPGDTMEDDRCIFSAVLLEALWGHHDAAFSAVRTPRCITSGSLAGFLEDAVPKRAATYGVTLQPDIVTGLREGADVYVATVPADAPPLRDWPAMGTTGAMGPEIRSLAGGRRGWSTAAPAAVEPTAERSMSGGIFKSVLEGFAGATDFTLGGGASFAPHVPAAAPAPVPPPPPPDIAAVVDRDTAAAAQARDARTAHAEALRQTYDTAVERPTHYETGAGFSIEGARALTVRLGGLATAVPERDRTWWRVERTVESPEAPWPGGQLARPLPLLIELDDGRWTGAAAMPDFVATFTVTPPGIASIIYRAMWDHPQAGAVTEAAVAALRAGTLARDAAIDYAIELRRQKFVDPILGVIAAYLYDARGDTESIRQIAYYLASRRQPIPYDLALLGRLPVTRDELGLLTATVPAVAARTPRTDLERQHTWTVAATPEDHAPVAGAFPWMRQGWAQLDDDDPVALPGMADLVPHLTAAPFTTLDRDGGLRLGQLLFDGGR